MGTRLLESALERVPGQIAAPVYLDTISARLVRYYERFGFEVKDVNDIRKIAGGVDSSGDASLAGWEGKPVEELERQTPMMSVFMLLRPERYRELQAQA